MIVSFPHNPTTAVATAHDLQRLVDLAREHEFLLVHDFAYAEIAFDGHKPQSILAADGAADCAVELYSLTKSFSMAGWRVGFVVGRPDVVAALTKLKSYLDYGTFQPIQIAAIVALRTAFDYPAEICDTYRRRRDALCSGLARAGWVVEPPLGTMFVWAPIPDRFRALGSLEFATHLARRAHVATSPGIGFGDGGDGHIRFALVENEQRINQATRAIRALLGVSLGSQRPLCGQRRRDQGSRVTPRPRARNPDASIAAFQLPKTRSTVCRQGWFCAAASHSSTVGVRRCSRCQRSIAYAIVSRVQRKPSRGPDLIATRLRRARRGAA